MSISGTKQGGFEPVKLNQAQKWLSGPPESEIKYIEDREENVRRDQKGLTVQRKRAAGQAVPWQCLCRAQTSAIWFLSCRGGRGQKGLVPIKRQFKRFGFNRETFQSRDNSDACVSSKRQTAPRTTATALITPPQPKEIERCVLVRRRGDLWHEFLPWRQLHLTPSATTSSNVSALLTQGSAGWRGGAR